MITPPPKRRYVETYEVVWRPHRCAPSLLGEGYSGSSLTGACQETREQHRQRKWNDRRRDYRLDRKAQRDFAYYRGEYAEIIRRTFDETE